MNSELFGKPPAAAAGQRMPERLPELVSEHMSRRMPQSMSQSMQWSTPKPPSHPPKVTVLIGSQATRMQRQLLTTEARAIWGLLHGDDLLRAHGNLYRLARLVRLRYAASHTAADLRVREFFARHYPDA